MLSRARPGTDLLLTTALLLGASLLSSGPSAAQHRDTLSGNYWLPKCGSFNPADQSHCGLFILGWAEGFSQGVNFGQLGTNATPPFCIPAGVTIQQLVNVAAAWGRRNPSLTHMPFTALLATAMTEAFPC
jgi:hypothetical protein